MPLRQASLACLLALASLASCRDVWLYTLISADYGGMNLLPHFLDHYTQRSGLKLSRIIINVHHNPAKYPRQGLDLVMGTCASYRVYCRVWEGEFSSEAHYNRTLRMLRDFLYDPEDWVIVADSDEFQDWGAAGARAALSKVDAQGGTYVQGTLLDRVAVGGRLEPIVPSPSLASQFPLGCHVVKKLYKGWDFKIVAFKNFLRAGRANHFIVKPSKAHAYLGPCRPGRKCPRGRNINLKEDWYHLTPYAMYKDSYRYKNSAPGASGLWDAVSAKERITINHYKWHAGALPNMRDRAEYYSGNCTLGVNEATCTPVLLHWRESVKTYAAIRDTRTLNLTGMYCKLMASDVPPKGAASRQARGGASAAGQVQLAEQQQGGTGTLQGVVARHEQG